MGLTNPAVREVLRLMGPRVLGVAVVQINFIVNTIIALGIAGGECVSAGVCFWSYDDATDGNCAIDGNRRATHIFHSGISGTIG